MEAVYDSYDILILCNRGGIAHHSHKWPLISDYRCKESRWIKLVMWPLCALTVEAIRVQSLCSLLRIPVSPDTSFPVILCSLPLLCSLSEDWGEPIAPCYEGVLWAAAAVCRTGGQCWTKGTRCRGRSVPVLLRGTTQPPQCLNWWIAITLYDGKDPAFQNVCWLLELGCRSEHVNHTIIGSCTHCNHGRSNSIWIHEVCVCVFTPRFWCYP